MRPERVVDARSHGYDAPSNCGCSLSTSCVRAVDISVDTVREVPAGLNDNIFQSKLPAVRYKIREPHRICDWAPSSRYGGGVLSSGNVERFRWNEGCVYRSERRR